MNYIISASTDVGTKKSTNQDSLSARIIKTPQGRMAFAVLCDGMGGLARGEVASASVINAFTAWMYTSLPQLSQSPIEGQRVREQWEEVVLQQNERIMAYGKHNGINIGTTAVVMLLTDSRYYILNVGDSRVYEITNRLDQLTHDQTVVANEVALGHITQEEAKNDPRRNVLLQCIGASSAVTPEFFLGDTRQNAVYMMCSDGFRHVVTPQEMYEGLNPDRMADSATMKKQTERLIELNKQRQEDDNISVITIRTF